MEGNSERIVYKECQRNYAATMGVFIGDGCNEYMAGYTMITGLYCVACGCHRNFHHKVVQNNTGAVTIADTGNIVEGSHRLRDVPVAVGMIESDRILDAVPIAMEAPQGAWRRCAVYTSYQKERMRVFAESLGWKMPKRDRNAELQHFCDEIGVPRKNFKIWLNNHKNKQLALPYPCPHPPPQ